jgi:hypothetical protein
MATRRDNPCATLAMEPPERPTNNCREHAAHRMSSPPLTGPPGKLGLGPHDGRSYFLMLGDCSSGIAPVSLRRSRTRSTK